MKKSGLSYLWIVIALALSCLSGACAGPQRVHGSTTIAITMKDGSFQPFESRVTSGAEISLALTNEDSRPHDWTLLDRFVQIPPAGTPLPEVRFSQRVDPGQTLTVHFKAPTAPGEYLFISSLPADMEVEMTGILLVVVPPESQ